MKHLEGINEINKRYNLQIKCGSKISVIHKELFNLTHNFTVDDWRRIRTKKYYDTIDAMRDVEIEHDFGSYKKKAIDYASEYTLQCVVYYLKHIKKEMPG
jgi:hypothetical protein